MDIQLFLHLVPSIPQVEIVPSYSNNNQALEKLFIITTVNQTVSDMHFCMISDYVI